MIDQMLLALMTVEIFTNHACLLWPFISGKVEVALGDLHYLFVAPANGSFGFLGIL